VRDDVPEPRPADGDVLVKVIEAGVCGTDVEMHEGLYGQPPTGCHYLVLGHENLGVVETAPAGSSFASGDLVVATVRRPCPDACLPCVSDQNDMCLTGNYLERGIKGIHGFMSEWYAESPRYLVKLPARLRPFAVLMEPMSIVQKGIDQALRVQARVAWEPRTAVVLGAGPVGILAALALRLRGLDVWVTALEPEGSFKDRLLSEIGARYLSTASVAVDALPSRLGRIDLVLEATGADALVFPAMRIVGPDGVCVLTSVTNDDRLHNVDVAAWNREMVLGNRLVLGTVNAGRRHFEAAARDLEAAESRHPGWLGRLITRRIRFTEATQALTRDRDDVKTVLEFA
jgi:threonine dehydrogenase-like Zn-dependent dehydrogenase